MSHNFTIDFSEGNELGEKVLGMASLCTSHCGNEWFARDKSSQLLLKTDDASASCSPIAECS